MRFLIAFLALVVAAYAQQPAQQPIQPAEMRKPIMVSSLSDLKQPEAVAATVNAAIAAPAAPAPAAAAAPAASAPAPPSPFDADLSKLEKSITDHQASLETLQKQLEEGLKQKQRLTLAQKLMTSIIALHKAEKVLADLDAKVAEGKAAIKKFGDAADEIAESIKRSEEDHKKELLELNKKMATLRSDLAAQEKGLADLTARRERVAGTVQRWKSHVAVLKDAHETLVTGGSAAAAAKPASAEDPFAVPEPPASTEELLAAPPAAPAADAPAAPSAALDAKLAAAAAAAEQEALSHLHALAAGSASGPEAAQKAFAQLAKRTFQELGQGRFAGEGTLRGAEQDE